VLKTTVFVMTIPANGCHAFCEGVSPQRGSYHWDALPGVEMIVVPSEVKDRDGNVVEVVG
jgi:hypothetical protein